MYLKQNLSGPADNFDVFISVAFTKYSNDPHNKCNYNGVRQTLNKERAS